MYSIGKGNKQSRVANYEERRLDSHYVGQHGRHVRSNRRRHPYKPDSRSSRSFDHHVSDQKRRRGNEYHSGVCSIPSSIDRGTHTSQRSTAFLPSSYRRYTPHYSSQSNDLSDNIQPHEIHQFDERHSPKILHSRAKDIPNDLHQLGRRDIALSQTQAHRIHPKSFLPRGPPPHIRTTLRYEKRAEGKRRARSDRIDRNEGFIHISNTYRPYPHLGETKKERPGRYFGGPKGSGSVERPIDTFGLHDASRAKRVCTGRRKSSTRSNERVSVPFVTDSLVEIPLPWKQRNSSLSTWKSFGDVIYKYGSTTDILSFNLFRELILSPMNGIAAHVLPTISSALTTAPHLVNRSGYSIVPETAYPKSLRRFLTVPLAKLFAMQKVHFNGQVTVSGVPSLSGEEDGKGLVWKEIEDLQLLVENLEYAFEAVRATSSGLDQREGNGPFLWRGRRFPHSNAANEKIMVCLDPLYTRIMKHLHVDFETSRRPHVHSKKFKA